MAPFEALYMRKCRISLRWSDFDEALIIGHEMIQETIDTIRRIHVTPQPLGTGALRFLNFLPKIMGRNG